MRSETKVILGENVTIHHRIVVCTIHMKTSRRKRVQTEPTIRWLDLYEDRCEVKFRERVKLYLTMTKS